MFKTVLIPVDVAVPDHTQGLLAAATKLTADWGCQLHVVTVIPDAGMPIVGSYFDKEFESASKTSATQELSKAVTDAGVTADQYVLSGRIYDKIIGLAKTIDADMIFLGAHQPGLGDYLLGSNAARIVRHAPQSVFVLRTS